MRLTASQISRTAGGNPRFKMCIRDSNKEGKAGAWMGVKKCRRNCAKMEGNNKVYLYGGDIRSTYFTLCFKLGKSQ